MPNSNNVTAGKPNIGGAIYRAALPLVTGESLPTSTSTSMASLTSFKELGYVSQDGVVNSNTMSSEDIKAWGGNNVLNTQTDKPDTFKMKLIEALNQNVIEAVYGTSNVSKDSQTGEITVLANSEELEYCAWVIDMILRDGAKKRIVIPNGKVSSLADISYKDNEAVGYEITISAQPDENGNTHYEYIL